MMKRLAAIAVSVLFSGSAMAQVAGPHTIVYKTRKGYRNLVPVQLSDDKQKLISYPAPQDLQTGGAPALPVLLHKGWLLDLRGVNGNTAFTRYTYRQYSALKAVPSEAALLKKLTDKSPMTTIYDCGPRPAYSTPKELNDLIDKGLLDKKCKKMYGK